MRAVELEGDGYAVSGFFDYGEHLFQFSEVFEDGYASLGYGEYCSVFSDGSFLNQVLRNKKMYRSLFPCAITSFIYSFLAGLLKNPGALIVAKSGSGSPAKGSTVPSAVVLIGNLNLLSSPLLNLIVHIMESVPLRGIVWDPRGTKSEYPLTSTACWGQIFTQLKHSQHCSGS